MIADKIFKNNKVAETTENTETTPNKSMSKLIDKFLLVPILQIRFRNKHSTIDQVHRITYFKKALERKGIYLLGNRFGHQ